MVAQRILPIEVLLFMDEADVRGDEQNRMDPRLMANAMLDIIPKDTGLFSKCCASGGRGFGQESSTRHMEHDNHPARLIHPLGEFS